MSGHKRVLFFGDQLVAGVGDPAGIGWVGRVSAACYSRGLPILAYNLGVVGETSVQIALRVAAEALPRLAPDADCRVVLCVTANDSSTEAGHERIPAATALEAVERMLDHADALKLPALVIGPPPVGDAVRDTRIKAGASSLVKTCGDRRVPCVDLYALLDAQRASVHSPVAGSWHPTEAGYDLLAEVIAGPLFDWLATRSLQPDLGKTRAFGCPRSGAPD